MRLKTFIATYLLFLVVLFSSIGIVSLYLNNSQLAMLQEKRAGQFQTITSSLNRDIAVLWGRNNTYRLANETFYAAVDALVMGYASYYRRHNVHIAVTDTRLSRFDLPPFEIVFENNDKGYFISIVGLLSEPFGYFLLEYSLNITENIMAMRNIQYTLLVSVVFFSILGAIGLYVILSTFFKKLQGLGAGFALFDGVPRFYLFEGIIFYAQNAFSICFPYGFPFNNKISTTSKRIFDSVSL